MSSTSSSVKNKDKEFKLTGPVFLRWFVLVSLPGLILSMAGPTGESGWRRLASDPGAWEGMVTKVPASWWKVEKLPRSRKLEMEEVSCPGQGSAGMSPLVTRNLQAYGADEESAPPPLPHEARN